MTLLLVVRALQGVRGQWCQRALQRQSLPQLVSVRMCTNVYTCVRVRLCACQPMSLINTSDSPVGRAVASGRSRAVVSKSTAKAVPPTVGECVHVYKCVYMRVCTSVCVSTNVTGKHR